MVDPGTGLAVLGGAIGSKELVQKILGPTADYLGTGLADWTRRAVKNTGRVFENAARKLGGKIDQPGAVPPKVLKGILEEAPFCDDELGAEYFGGVLASSRTGVDRDDRGATFLALIGRLSTYQIRSHFFFYTLIRSLYAGLAENIGVHSGRVNLRTFVPVEAYATAMEVSGHENLDTILTHVMFGLAREMLIEADFVFGARDGLKQHFPNAPQQGIVFSPSALGVQLFLWAHGKGDLQLNDLLTAGIQFTSNVTLKTTPGSCSVRDPSRTFPKVAQVTTEQNAHSRS
jgi:hypothetical protein